MIGRVYETNILKKAIKSNHAELGIVYGRRRVGKSFLLKSIIREGQSLDMYFEAIRGYTQQEQINHFCKQLAEQTQTVQVKADSWEVALDAMTQYISKGQHYIVFDELPWMSSEKQELVNLLKYYWDNKWILNKHLTLVLCGSIAHFMVKHVVHSHALHNRKTFELKLDPLPSYEAQGFFKNKKSNLEITKFLLTFGGIPKYLEQINSKETYSVNVDKLCFQKSGFFTNEFETVFKEQFKTTRTYEKIIRALVHGAKTKEEISLKAGMAVGGGLTSYLENLEKADFIKKKTSIAIDKTLKKAKTHKYILWDEWLKFYLYFMEPAIDLIKSNTRPGLFLKRADSLLPTYWGLNFEIFCQKNIRVILDYLNIPESEIISIGPYFQQPSRATKSKGVQVDLMITRKGFIITIIECKFSENPIGLKVTKEIDSKIKALGLPKKYTIEKILVTASEVTSELLNADYFDQIISIDEFYSTKASV
jgi:AAA+ ATPase superfamily predicted ATPase